MAIFDELPGLVSEVLGDLATVEGLGVVATYTHVDDGSYDVRTGTVGETSTGVESLRVIVEDVQGKDLIDGLVEAQDKKIIIAGADMATPPGLGDTLTVNIVTYTVLRIVEVRPGAEVALYELFVRAS